MNCKEIRERMPDVAAGFSEPTADERKHLDSCGNCAEELKGMQATMALLDEWQAPEPSPYFDTRLQARLREEMAKPAAGWLQWFRRPVLAAALTVSSGSWRGPVLHAKHGDYQSCAGRNCECRTAGGGLRGKRSANLGQESRLVCGFRFAG